MADKRVDIILLEVDEEYSIRSYVENSLKRRISRVLMIIDNQRQLLSDLMIGQQETM